MTRPNRARGWILPVAVFLALACARGAFWGAIHDEGVTYDIALYHLDLANRVPPDGTPRGLAEELESSAPQSFGGLAAVLTSSRCIHPPLYYSLVYGWTRLAGTSAAALRIPGIAIGAFAVFAMFHLAWILTRSRTASTWASLLLAVSPAHIGFALYLRPYGLEIAIAISSCVALLRWHAGMFAKGEWRWFGTFTLLSVLGLYTLYHYVFVLLFQFAFLFAAAWAAPRRSFASDLSRGIASGLGVVLLYAPWLPFLRATLGWSQSSPSIYAGFMPLVEWPVALFEMAVQMTLGHTAVWKQLAFVVLIIGLVGILVAIHRQEPRAVSATREEHAVADLSRTHRIFWLCFLVYPITMVIADAVRDTHTFLVWKTSIILLPLAILSVVLLLQQLRRPRMRKLAFGLCTLIVFSATVTNTVAAMTGDRRNQRALANYLRENDRADHVMVLRTDARGHALTAMVYWKNLGVRDVRVALGAGSQLDTVMASLAANPEFAQITLVDFTVSYESSSHWAKERIDRALAVAAAAGKDAGLVVQEAAYTKDIGR
jgi:hypothetical protein